MEKDKIVFKGSHPDSLYRVQPNSESRVDKMARLLRILRWPMALIVVCIALALFVYFLMPDNIDSVDSANDTYWEPVTAGHTYNPVTDEQTIMPHRTRPPGYKHRTYTKAPVTTYNPGTKTPEIDFYDTENDKNAELTSIIDTITETSPNRVLPIKPVFPAHIAPEVQYGNEKADADKLRTPKVLEEGSTLPDESTLKPHITQKPEKPLAVYFKDLSQATTTTTEAITRAETVNQFANYGDKQTTKKVEISTKSHPTAYKDYHTPLLKVKPQNIKQYLVTETPEAPPEIDAYYGSRPKGGVNFTSGHSNLFGISIEDAAKMRSTTQSSLYNTRVSPTLPTWRDGDDTTKKYPVNVNYEVPQCRSTRLPLCSEILPYDLAGSPATIGGVVATSLLSQIEYLVATNCSERVRHFTCALLEPECNPPPYPPKMPCFNLCKAIMDGCEDQIPRELAAAFDCQQYSRTNCVAAKPPCFARELTCGDGSCIPRDWVCDGNKDCPHGEDEAVCTKCKRNEFRCSSGGCILRQWLCDGYSDCPEGEDEGESCENERHEADELGEESAGSAPAPVVRRPNKIPTKAKAGDSHRTGESHNSEELLVTSDSNNAFKRNFTRRPSLSRLTPYARSTAAPVKHKSDEKDFESTKKIEGRKIEGGNIENTETAQNATEIDDSLEDVNVGDLGFFEDLKKTKEQNPRTNEQKPPMKTKFTTGEGPRLSPSTPMTKLDKSIDKLERVIDGASLLKKVKAEIGEDNLYSTETNNTSIEKFDDIPLTAPNTSRAGNSRGQGSKSAHASPCPSGELRCVDGRCITLAQLCDGTIDCSDHADEDNCYT